MNSFTVIDVPDWRSALTFPFALMYLDSRLPRPRWWHYVLLGLNVVPKWMNGTGRGFG